MQNAPWAREADGVIAGVCSFIAKRFSVDVMLIRIVWLCAVFFAGFGLGLYLILALSLPRIDKLDTAYAPRAMGVAARFAKRFDVDVGLTRCGFLFLLFSSAGLFFFAYLLMHFILPSK
jgi:phage shock protein PspC (stress-responsive transcriptional regulator)